MVFKFRKIGFIVTKKKALIDNSWFYSVLRKCWEDFNSKLTCLVKKIIELEVKWLDYSGPIIEILDKVIKHLLA